MTDPIIPDPTPATTPEPVVRPARRIPLRALMVGGAMLAIGCVAGAAGWALTTPQARVAFDTALATSAVSALADDNSAQLQGRVTDIFGNRFVLEDSSGRALIETGRDGEGGALVAKDETVTVQGRFDRGELHATGLRHADGKTVELLAKPRRPDDGGPHGRHEGRGPHEGHGPHDAGPGPHDDKAPPAPPPQP